MLEKCGYLWGRALSPLEWAFAVFHLMEDKNEGQQSERLRRREDWALHLLIAHDPDKARDLITKEPGDLVDKDTEIESDAQQFLVSDRWFSDRRPLDAVLAEKQDRPRQRGRG